MRHYFTLLFAMVCLLSYADQQPIILSHKGIQHDRSELPVYNDMPLAYYDNGGKTREIIIDGGGVVSYYDVEISSVPAGTVELTTQVDGTHDTFDISSLPVGSHVLTIVSAGGNIYEGTFYKD